MRTHKWVRKFRQRTHMSCRGFATMIGIDGGNYNKYETGKLVPGEDFIERFSEVCKLGEVETELIRALASCDRMLQCVIREDEK